MGISSSRDQRNGTRIRARLEVASHLVSGLSGQLEIHDDDVGLLAHRFGKCTLAVRCGQHGKTFSAEIDTPYVECVGVVVDDEEARV